jgi:hypothetical protein
MKPTSAIVDHLVSDADPVRDADVEGWLRSPAAAQIRAMDGFGDAGAPTNVVPLRRRSRARTVALAAAILVVVAGAAGGAAVLLGEPAPPSVKRDLRSVDEGFPPDLRFNPDVADAHSVATTGDSTIYVASLKDGGHCTEIVTSGIPRGAVCTPAALMSSQPIEVTIPFTDPVTEQSPVTMAGRVNADGAASLQVQYGDGSSDAIALGEDGFFVFDVPAAHLTTVHRDAFSLVALDAQGNEVARADVPAVDPEPEGPIDDPAPITVDTISDGSDYTKVLGVRGVVNAEGAVTLEFRYPDGTVVRVDVHPDGSYDLAIPTERQGDLDHAPGILVARDGDGNEVASVPVASVAFWRGYQGG